MNITLSTETAETVKKIQAIIAAIGFDLSLNEVVERLIDDGAEVACLRLSMATREEEPLNAA